MFLRKFVFIFLFIFFTIFNLSTKAFAAEQPTAIFHAFNQNYNEVEKFVCTLADQGYSHVQISPTQKSNPGKEWWNRYQPLDYSVIEGLGSEGDLKNSLIKPIAVISKLSLMSFSITWLTWMGMMVLKIYRSYPT